MYCWSPPYLYRIEYRQLVVTLFFLKRLNDIFEENADELEREGKTKKKAWENKNVNKVNKSGVLVKFKIHLI